MKNNQPAINKRATRHEKRQARMKVDGRDIKVTAFLKRRAADLPAMTDKGTGSPIDHAKNLNALYMIEGAEGVNNYINAVRAVIRRDKGKNVFTRIAGWFEVKWLKIRRMR